MSIPLVTGDEDVLESASFDEAQIMKHIPEDFRYNIKECLVRPIISGESDIPESLLTPVYPFFARDCLQGNETLIATRPSVDVCGFFTR